MTSVKESMRNGNTAKDVYYLNRRRDGPPFERFYPTNGRGGSKFRKAAQRLDIILNLDQAVTERIAVNGGINQDVLYLLKAILHNQNPFTSSIWWRREVI
ncbi:hypothetical protein J6590_039602 [Homalodisca vitripennis]|nr:hypothetical protein J6590_039602 [Homalodisca vitripennis]